MSVFSFSIASQMSVYFIFLNKIDTYFLSGIVVQPFIYLYCCEGVPCLALCSVCVLYFTGFCL